MPIGPFQQAFNDANYYSTPYFAGTTGGKRRLEGMWLQTDSTLKSTRPVVKYRLVNPNCTLTSTGTWGQYVGTKGQRKAVVGLEMWTTTDGFHVW